MSINVELRVFPEHENLSGYPTFAEVLADPEGRGIHITLGDAKDPEDLQSQQSILISWADWRKINETFPQPRPNAAAPS
jgi:hypothetical protein